MKTPRGGKRRKAEAAEESRSDGELHSKNISRTIRRNSPHPALVFLGFPAFPGASAALRVVCPFLAVEMIRLFEHLHPLDLRAEFQIVEDLQGVVHIFHFAHAGVLAREMRRGIGGDEELRATGVLA